MAWDFQVLHEGSACERWSFHVIHEGFASKDYLSILLIVPFWCVLLVLLFRRFFQNDGISLGCSNPLSSCFFLVLLSCCFILVHFARRVFSVYIYIYTRGPSCKMHEDEAARKNYQKETPWGSVRKSSRNFRFERNNQMDEAEGRTRME